MTGVVGYTTLFAGNFAPRNWALCNGQILQISQNLALFSLLGKAYGGDGIRTFALPDLRGKAVIGAGQGISNYLPGQSGGAEFTIVNNPNAIPNHTHPVGVQITSPAGGVANSKTPGSAAYAASANNLYNAVPTSQYFMGTYPCTLSTSTMGAMNTQPIPTLHPVLALNYIICIAGLFPQRGNKSMEK